MSVQPVLIAGGGPVGMTLALELAHHGVATIIFERNETTTRHPKMDLTNGRSMELFGRMGLAAALREVGVPEGNPFDILWATSPSGQLLHRFAYSSADGWREVSRQVNDGSFTLEPPMRISQIVLEPVLKRALDMSPLVDVRFGWRVDSFSQNDAGVEVTAQSVTDGGYSKTQGAYLVGADGGGSRVRRQLGIPLEGMESVGRVYMIHFRSAARDVLAPWGIAWHLQTPRGTLVAQDDKDIWTLHVPLNPGEDEEKIVPADLLREWAGRDFAFEILVANPWSPRLLLAERYSEGRVFLAGDSVHQVIPTGGYGMNTGIGDAVDLGWKLAAVQNGWGGPYLLDSYQIERRPVAVSNTAGCLRHASVRNDILQLFETPTDDLGQAIAAIGNAENESFGLEHGYRYDDSPIIDYNGLPAGPPCDPVVYRPSTAPGARLPHIFLGDGSALYDHLGSEFTLLSAGRSEAHEFSTTANRLGIPLKVAVLDDEPRLRVLERSMLLIRPDHHVAWRGDALPSNLETTLARAAGHLPAGT